jgi:uncharacterized membrane protein
MLPAFALARNSPGPARLALGVAAAGELVGDKLPMTPSRLAPPALLARLASGATAGGTLAARNGASRMLGAVAGAAGALGFAAGCAFVRRAVVRRTGLPDPIVALGEDAIAIAAALALTRPQR